MAIHRQEEPVSALIPLCVLLFLGLMGWVLLRLIGGPGGPETFNPNSCSSCSSNQGGAAERRGDERDSGARPKLRRFPVAAGRHRLRSPADR
jgi:hypothetical protein